MEIHKWDEICHMMFEKIKDVSSSAPVLVPANYKTQFRFHVNSYEKAIGVTLTQLD